MKCSECMWRRHNDLQAFHNCGGVGNDKDHNCKAAVQKSVPVEPATKTE